MTSCYHKMPDVQRTAVPEVFLRFCRTLRHPGYLFRGILSLPGRGNPLGLVKEKDYFVITTNVDNQFQRAGFDEKRLFCAQGDYGLFQSGDPADQNTYDNSDWVEKALADQGFVKDENGVFQVPETGKPAMRISAELIPTCPGGAPAVMNLRCDDTFVEDEKWHLASAAYADFLQSCETRSVLLLELGVGGNTPVLTALRTTWHQIY